MVQQLRQAHERTLFHLVPLNHKALAVLGQRQNGRFVSNCGTESQPIPGLEVGYHVSKKRSADVIATVGRAGDLTIDDEQVSRIHFDFQVRPAVCALFLCMRRAGPSGIYVKGSSFDGTRDKSDEEKPQWVDDGIHLGYSKKHIIDILGHQFQIGWCETISDSMKAKVDQEYKRAQQEALNPNVAVQYEDTVIPESAWEQQHMTRNIITRRRAPVEEDVSCRTEIGRGTFGKVYKSVDKNNRRLVAVKEIALPNNDTDGRARERAYSELKILGQVQHENIIELLGHGSLMGTSICFYMPLRSGSLHDLMKGRRRAARKKLCMQVLPQMLCALDHLDSHNMCHRDVKPGNVLYSTRDDDGQYLFQLADFGMSRLHGIKGVQEGTRIFWAPEVTNGKGWPQGHRVDIWALYVSLVCVVEGEHWPGGTDTSAEMVQEMILANDYIPKLRIMAREDPKLRATAAQCLVEFFEGKGLTTTDVIPPPPASPSSTPSRPPMRRSRRIAAAHDFAGGPAQQGRLPPERVFRAVPQQQQQWQQQQWQQWQQWQQQQQQQQQQARVEALPPRPPPAYYDEDVKMGGMGSTIESPPTTAAGPRTRHFWPGD